MNDFGGRNRKYFTGYVVIIDDRWNFNFEKKKEAERKKKRKAIEGSLFDNFSEEMFDKLNQFHRFDGTLEKLSMDLENYYFIFRSC